MTKNRMQSTHNQTFNDWQDPHQRYYHLSPTQTNLISKMGGNSSGSFSLLATSFNKLPSVARNGNVEELVKKLFMKGQNMSSNANSQTSS